MKDIRRSLFAPCVVFWFLLTLTSVGQKYDGPIVDCHVHLWDLERPEGLGWIKKENETLYRNFLPGDHEPIAKANGVAGVVIVQAGQSLPDNQWNLDITAHNKGLYRGVVGNLSEVMGTDKFQPLFEKLCKDPRYVGYRLSGREQEGLSEELFRDLRSTAEKGKAVDVLVGGYGLKDVAVIAKRVPKLRIMIDHFGNLELDGKALDSDWVADFRAVAKHPNVYCKVSALYGRVKKQPAPRDVAFYRGVLDLAWECFGEDRLVFGSDWPVTRTSGDYGSVLVLTNAYFGKKDPGVSKKLFHSNAIKFYRLAQDDGLGAALEKLKFPGITINMEERSVDVESVICLRTGGLELIACTKDTKEHESIVAVNAKARHIHTGLLLLGAKSGNPAMRKAVDEEGTRWVDLPPRGGPVDVSLVFAGEDGKTVERPISDFVTGSEEENKKFPTNTFLFAGSHLHGEGDGPRRYLADGSGNVISISTFGDEVLCLPGMHAHDSGGLMWGVDSTHLPPLEAKVILRLRPRIAAAE